MMNGPEQTAITPAVREEIMARLAAAEREHGVRILMAVESGSRAWGFPSPNSDYDVRFVYAHPRDWYLSLDVEDRRDVIEYEITDDIDLNGWDVRKALKLFAKSNPSFVEWIQSPIVYRDESGFAERARTLLPQVYAVDSGVFHYLSMADKNYRGYLKAQLVPLKKYFYALRPLLAIRWLERFRTPAPIEFDRLRELVADNTPVNKDIERLLARKQRSQEKEFVPAMPALNDFIEHELSRFSRYQAKGDAPAGGEATALDAFFRDCLPGEAP
ncbi:MAG: nucleotidyltransferase domain-containing protein [Alcanivorax sp.]|uniref:nucleotidyltransferase domain-containing protein n=2 Tax=Alloalcanivorax marinus TaxID=1177169 RepID=UPI001EF7EE98|nr:nucleotidyltransferase domain-containing protein [Alloalcanivorax marinus]MBM7332729.1 nucleotidyltransferase domain-containing protein [Alloalcanivorax marinus]